MSQARGERRNSCTSCRRRSWPKSHHPRPPTPPCVDGDPANDQEPEENESSDNKDDRFYATWDKFTRDAPSIRPASTIKVLNDDLEGRHKRVPGWHKSGLSSRVNTATSFDEVAKSCSEKVTAIANECRRLNKKYHDPMFDLRDVNTLVSLSGWVGQNYDISAFRLSGGVADVKRVGDIFENPVFFPEEAGVKSVHTVRQGLTGDCWFIASVTALAGVPERIKKICVKRDEKVGVYGFCFYRDGEWISEVIDDRLCVRFHEDQKQYLLNVYPDKVETREELPKKFRQSLLKGADSLYFASCKDSDETWLPLLEKAYAKIHLSYQSIEGGWPGEGIEDLTGGINTTVDSEDILDKDRLWAELEEVNKQFLFGCGSRQPLSEEDDTEIEGVVRSHAYTVLAARTVEHLVNGKTEKVRLLKLRNPWGQHEWKGAWSDGSKEWKPETMKELDHSFGDDGIFWMSFEDFLKTYPRFDRTRLLDSEWTMSQQWTTVSVPNTTNNYDTGYLPQKFKLHITKAGPAIIMLSKPDSRYFRALQGRYSYMLHFRLYREGEHEYIVRSMSQTASGRSCSVEIDCDPGDYTIVMKLTPYRNDNAKTAAEIIKNFKMYGPYGREKVLEVGKMFDLAHARGRLREAETAEAKKARERNKEKKHAEQKAERGVERERRRKQKMQQRRIARKEKRKEEKKKAGQKDQQSEGNVATPDESEKGAQEDGDDSQEPKDVSDAQTVNNEEQKPGDENKDKLESKQVDSEDHKPSQAAQDGVPDEKAKSEADAEAKTSEESHVAQGQSAESTMESKDVSGDKKDEKANVGTSSDSEAQEVSKESSTEQKESSSDVAEVQAPTDKKVVSVRTAQGMSIYVDQTTGQQASITIDEAPQQCSSQEAVDLNVSDNISDVGSVQDEDFDWDSDIDGSVESNDDEVKEEDIFGDDSWFALATIGLRLYSKDAEAYVEVDQGQEQ